MGDYLILKSNGCINECSFQEEVAAKMDDGFLPIGGLTVIPSDLLDRYDKSVAFYQAMYRGVDVKTPGFVATVGE